MKIVMNHGDTVGREVNIQLDRVSAELDGSSESGQSIFRKLARGAAMADAFDAAS
jgi:hypothetical protein